MYKLVVWRLYILLSYTLILRTEMRLLVYTLYSNYDNIHDMMYHDMKHFDWSCTDACRRNLLLRVSGYLPSPQTSNDMTYMSDTWLCSYIL